VTRPVIGISIGYDQQRDGVFLLRQDYVRSVEQAGGLPVVLAPGKPEDAPELLRGLSGLVLTGGADVDPSLYGEAPHAAVTRVIRERDDFELALSREALRRDSPLLAICRGCQVLNVATGGTLVQDIPSELVGASNHDPDRERWQTAHAVRIAAGTLLRRILCADEVAVNSFHHQAVKRLGEGLVASAHAEDGVIEGVEAPERRFAVGVQWHPESFWNREPNFRRLFLALVAEARS
jgi:putative glutamine amidotransferase